MGVVGVRGTARMRPLTPDRHRMRACRPQAHLHDGTMLSRRALQALLSTSRRHAGALPLAAAAAVGAPVWAGGGLHHQPAAACSTSTGPAGADGGAGWSQWAVGAALTGLAGAGALAATTSSADARAAPRAADPKRQAAAEDKLPEYTADQVWTGGGTVTC